MGVGRVVSWSIQAGAQHAITPMLAANACGGRAGVAVASTHLEHRRAPLQGRELDREALVEGGGAVLGADCPVTWRGGGEGSSVGGPSEGDDDHEARTGGGGTYEAVRRIIAARRCRASSTCSRAERPITRSNASLLTKRPQPSSPAVLR